MKDFTNRNTTRKDFLIHSLIAAAGLFCCGIGIYFTLQANIGVSPWDVLHQGLAGRLGMLYGNVSVMVALCKRSGWKIGPVTMIIYAVVTLAGRLLGGQVGIGTLMSVAYMGPALQIICRLTRFDAAQVTHQNLLESLRILAGKEAS